MSYYHGRQGSGAARARREVLRAEAEERNARTPEHRRAAFLYGPVPEGGVRTQRSVALYVNRFIGEHDATPFDVRDRLESES